MSIRPEPRWLRAVRREGAWPLIKRKVHEAWQARRNPRWTVWEWTTDRPLPESSADVFVRRCLAFTDVPDYALVCLSEEYGIDCCTRFLEEFAAGGTLWLALDGNRVAGYLWSRDARGAACRVAHLNPRDVWIYAVVTTFGYRGRGVARALLREVCRRDVPATGRAVFEAPAWHVQVARCLAAAGFREVACVPSHSRKQPL